MMTIENKTTATYTANTTTQTKQTSEKNEFGVEGTENKEETLDEKITRKADILAKELIKKGYSEEKANEISTLVVQFTHNNALDKAMEKDNNLKDSLVELFDTQDLTNILMATSSMIHPPLSDERYYNSDYERTPKNDSKYPFDEFNAEFFSSADSIKEFFQHQIDKLLEDQRLFGGDTSQSRKIFQTLLNSYNQGIKEDKSILNQYTKNNKPNVLDTLETKDDKVA